MNIFPKTVNSFTSMSSPDLTMRASLTDPDYEHLDIPDDSEDDPGLFEDVAVGVASGMEGFGKSLVGLADMVLGDMFDMDEDFYNRRTFGRPTGIAGGLAEGITQFAAGLIPGGFAVGLLGKVGKAASLVKFTDKTAKTIKGISTGAVADFVAFDGHEARLSDLLSEHTDLLYPVTEYLKSDQEDSEFEGRIKNVIEGGAIGGAVGALVWTGAKLIKSLKNFDGTPEAAKKLEDAKNEHDEALVNSGTQTKAGQEMAQRVEEELAELDPNTLVPGPKPAQAEPAGSTDPFATDLPDEFERVSGEQAIMANARITEAILGAQTKAEMDDIFKRFVPELVAKDAASPEKRAAEMIATLKASGMDASGIQKAIKGGLLDDDSKLGAMKEARAGQQIALLGMQASVDRLTTLGAQWQKLTSEGASEVKLDRIKILTTQEERRLKYFTATQAAYGTEFSKGLSDRQTGFVQTMQQNLGIKSAATKQTEDYDVTMAQAIADDDDLADAVAEINLQDMDESVDEILNESDQVIDPSSGNNSRVKQKEINRKRLNEKERLEKRKATLEKQLALKRKRSSELSGKDPEEIKGEAKAPKEDDADTHKLKSEVRSLEEKIKYHDQAFKDEQDIITLREEEYYVDKLSPQQYKARVKEKELQRQRAADAKKTTTTTVAELRKIVKSKADRQVKIASARETLEGLRNKLLQGDTPAKGKQLPDEIKMDPEMEDLLARIDSTKRMIREENDIQQVIEEVQSLSKLTDQQFVELSNAQKARNRILKSPTKTRLQELRKQKSAYVKRRTEAINSTGRGFTTKKAVNAWLKSRPGDMEKGFDTFMKRMMFAAEGESPLDAFVKTNEMSQMSKFDKFMNFGVRLLQRNLLSSPATTALNAGMASSVRFLLKMERIVGSGIGAVLKGDPAQRQVFKEALKFHQQAEDFSMVIKAASKATVTKSDVVTGGSSPFTDVSGRPNIDALDPELYGVNKDSLFGKAMGWVNTWFNLPFALNAGGDSMNKAAAGLANLRERLKNHVYTDAKWINKPVEAKEAWIKQTMEKSFLEDGAMYSESAVMSKLAKQARENILKSARAGEVVDNPMLIPNELRRLTLENKDQFLRDQDALRLLEETKQYTREITFTDPNQGEFVSLVNRAREKFPPLTLILPFVNTPAQILSFGLKRTWFGAAYDQIAPVLSKKAAARRAEMAGSMSPMQKAEYNGRMATATAGSAALLYYAYLNKDKITGSGPRNPDELNALKATGWQPNSFVIGDEDNPTYISYQRLDPFATMIGIVADIAEHMTMSPKLEPGSQESFAALTFGIAESITDKSFLRGLNNVLNAVQQPDIYGPKIGRDIVSGMAVPMSVNHFKDIGESEVLIRESRSVVDAVLRKLPIADEKVPPKRTFLGEEVYKQNPLGLLGVMNPVYVSSKRNDSVDKAVQEIVHGFDMPSPNYIGNKETDMRTFYNAKGDQAYDRFLALTATTTINGRTLRQALKGLVNSRQYKTVTKIINEGGGRSQLTSQDPRITQINKVLRNYRRKAKREMSAEFPELVQRVKDITAQTRSLQQSVSAELNNPIPTL